MTAEGPRFSICVPTYNRREILPDLIRSVADQTFRDFELVIIDDGSSDGTDEYIREEKDKQDFEIKYMWQPNGGRHRAINRIEELAAGELTIIFDSDDLLLPNALERLNHHWESIEEEKKEGYGGVERLCLREQDRKPIGTPYPLDVFDSDHVTNYYVLGLKGDRTRAIRTEVLKEIKFPEIEGENYLPPAFVWNRIALRYKYRCFNEPLAVKRYQPSGVTAKSALYRARNPLGARLTYLDFLTTICSAFPVKKRFYLRAYINYIRFSMHAGLSLGEIQKETPDKALTWAMLPPACLLYFRDRLYLKGSAR